MADLGGSTIASTYDRLLALPSGGLAGATLRALTDGNASATISLQVATTKTMIEGSGNKLFFGDENDEWISGNTTDLIIASGNDIHLTATTDINIPANVGLTFGSPTNPKIEGTGTDLAIDSTGNINIISTVNEANSIYIAENAGTSGTIKIHADQGTGADSINIVSDGGGVTFNAGGGVTLTLGGGSGDDFAVDGTTFVVESDNNKVGIGTATPSELLEISYVGGTETAPTGVLSLEMTDVSAELATGSGPSLDFKLPHSTSVTKVAARIGCVRETDDDDGDAGELVFYTSINHGSGTANSTEKMRINKLGNVGIGTISPKVIEHAVATCTVLHVNDPTTSATGTHPNSETGAGLVLSSDDGAVMGSGHRLGYISFAAAEDTSNNLREGARIEGVASEAWSTSQHGTDLKFYTETGGDTEPAHLRMTISEAGNVTTAAKTIHTRTSVNNLGANGSIPITATCVQIDANGSPRTGIRFAGSGVAGQVIYVNNTGGEALTFNGSEGTALVRAIHGDHDTMPANFMGMFVSDGTYWNLIAGGVDSQPDVGLTAS